MAETMVHMVARKFPQLDDPYWYTVCGMRFASDTESITTSDDKKAVTCPKCLDPKKN